MRFVRTAKFRNHPLKLAIVRNADFRNHHLNLAIVRTAKFRNYAFNLRFTSKLFPNLVIYFSNGVFVQVNFPCVSCLSPLLW